MGIRLIAFSAAPRSLENTEALAHLDAAYLRKLLHSNPGLLCSSHLGETCPAPSDAVGDVLFGWSASLPFTDVNMGQVAETAYETLAAQGYIRPISTPRSALHAAQKRAAQ